ncbi:glycosyltransferase [Allorhizobium sp. BGMRC 0089]|uniref:glycosyltransferase n=1 Tax=Allorhizobium sonneratiae TaxID=2934936 RepID=UPI00203396EA|nr:glycosyltransferase [Allorhizobium sonneratiae]MCM2292137.1 glycosyltransferase [Allorhizobium sonneratiae]
MDNVVSQPEKGSRRPLRLLEVLEPSGGGSGRHFVDLCAGLAERGHKVTAVYSPVRAERRFIEELSRLPLEKTLSLTMRRAVGPWDLSACLAMRRLIEREGPFDLIHGHSSKAGALTRLAAIGTGIPVVYTPHAFRTMDPLLSRRGALVYGGIERFLGNRLSKGLICVSGDEYNHALTLGMAEDRLFTVVNGVAYPPSGERSELRRRLGLASQHIVFGYIGRLCSQKAPERLVEAFASIALAMPRARLIMIGDGELHSSLQQQIDGLRLSDRIQIRSDIAGQDAIQLFDILVAPSRYEAMSYVMLEAAAGGLPLILTDIGGARVVLTHDVNGLLIPNTDDPGPLADALLAFDNPLTRTRLTAGALMHRHGYRIDTMVDETIAVYHHCLGTQPEVTKQTVATAAPVTDEIADPPETMTPLSLSGP